MPIPVTRLLGQSPAGLSATGDSHTRNYYDMVSARQEIDLRPQLERLDQLILRSAGLDPATLTFELRPLWQLSASEKASVALSKAQATAVYAGLNLWPSDVTAKLVQAQLVEDGIYPSAETIFAEARAATTGGGEVSGVLLPLSGAALSPAADFDPNQPRDPQGRWTNGGWASADPLLLPAASPSTFDPADLNSTARVGSLAKATIAVAQATRGPLLPGGVIQQPLQGTDPLDPTSLNTSAPSLQEQQALVATLNLIQSGATAGLNPHTYKNRPDPNTVEILPLVTGGHTTYDIFLGGLTRGTTRVTVDNMARKLYYNNMHSEASFRSL